MDGQQTNTAIIYTANILEPNSTLCKIYLVHMFGVT